MDELVRWLGKQLDEDERIAKEAGVRSLEWRLATPLDDEELGDASWLRPPELKHAERHDPARVLREVEAKRRILSEVVPEIDGLEDRIDSEWGAGDPAERESVALLRMLVLPYNDRPGYREEWRP